jgi:hypothetical protein
MKNVVYLAQQGALAMPFAACSERLQAFFIILL